MDMRIVGVPMIDGDPIQVGAEIARHVVHQLAREGAQIGHLGGVLGRHDEAEMVAVALAALGECISIRGLAGSIKEIGIAPIAGDTVPLKIRDVPGERRGAVARTVMSHDARLDHDPAIGPVKPGVQPVTK